MKVKHFLAQVAKPFFLALIVMLVCGLLAACGDSSSNLDTSKLEVITASSSTTSSIVNTNPGTTVAASTTNQISTVSQITSNNSQTTTQNTVDTVNSSPTANFSTTTVQNTQSSLTTANVSTTSAVATTVAPASKTNAKVPAIKSGVLLSPMYWEPQTWNNCAPMSIIFSLSYYGVKLTQKQVGHDMRPNDGDKHVKPEEIVAYIQKQGFKTMIRENGNFDILRKFLSAGIPVITQQWLHDPDDIGHYRVARGYDLNNNTFIFNDSMDRHAETVVSTELQDKLWKGFDRRYFPIYTAAQEPLVMAILGEDANADTNMQNALAAARKTTESTPKDIDGWRNLGYLDFAMGDYKAAINVWEQHLTKMLTPSDNGPYNRFLWYQLWPIESYNKLGNYKQVLSMAPNEITHTKVYAEARYEYAVALMNTGQRDAAITQLKTSLLDDANFKTGRDMLTKLGT